MASQASGFEITLEEFASLSAYIEALANNFPDELSHKDLAQKVGVSAAAVSKVKKRLFQICNKEIYALYRKFRLSDEPGIGTNLLVNFFLRSNIPVFRSKYAKRVIANSAIHEHICETWSEYGQYFSREDTVFVFGILAANIIALKNVSWSFMSGRSESEQQTLLMDDLKRNFSSLIKTFYVDLQSKEDFHRLLTIRDKFYYLVLNSILRAIGNSQMPSVLHDEMTVICRIIGKDKEVVYKHFEYYKKFHNVSEPAYCIDNGADDGSHVSFVYGKDFPATNTYSDRRLENPDSSDGKTC